MCGSSQNGASWGANGGGRATARSRASRSAPCCRCRAATLRIKAVVIVLYSGGRQPRRGARRGQERRLIRVAFASANARPGHSVCNLAPPAVHPTALPDRANSVRFSGPRRAPPASTFELSDRERPAGARRTSPRVAGASHRTAGAVPVTRAIWPGTAPSAARVWRAGSRRPRCRHGADVPGCATRLGAGPRAEPQPPLGRVNSS